MKIKLLFLCVILAMFVSLSFSQNLKKSIVLIGCKQVKADSPKPQSLNKEEFKKWIDSFKITGKESYLAKCKAKDGLYYRVLFEEESFENADVAKARLPKIGEIPSLKEDKSDFGVPIILREGFQIENKVFTIGNFAYGVFLEGNVKIWKDKLEKEIRKLK